jgi:cobalt-zinc-cadmium efflux system membrane fusion protein
MKIKLNIIIAIVFTLNIFSGCGKSSNEETVKEEDKKVKEKTELSLSKESIEETGINIETAETEIMQGYLKIPAKIITDQDFEAKVGSLVQGRVHKVFAKIGDFVKKGQVLMYIEGMEIGEIKSKFLKAKAELDYAESNYQRQKTLIEQNIGSQKSFHESEAEYFKALAEFNAEDKRIHSIGLSDEDVIGKNENSNSDHTGGLLSIKSPVSGLVTERNVVIGQFVDVSTNAFVVININNLIVEGQIREDEISRISGKPEIKFMTQTYPGVDFSGRIYYTSQFVDPQTRTISIRAKINNNQMMLKPEMFGLMHIPLSGSVKGIVINSEAIVKMDENDVIFIVKNDTTFEKRKVESGLELDGKIEIIKGLHEGEKYISKGAFYLKSELMKESFGEGE